MKVMIASESHQAMYKYHVQSSRQQLLEASKIKWFGLNYFVKLQWSIWQAQQFLTGEDLKQKRKQKGEILTITIKNACLGTVNELCSSSPNWCCRCPSEVYPPTGTLVYSLLTKPVVLLNMCCLSALDWNLLHILFLLRRCHMNQEKNTPAGRSAILFHRCLHHYGSNIPRRSVCIRSSNFQQTESRQRFLFLFHIACSDLSHFITLLHMLTMHWTNSEHLLSRCYLW